MADNSNNKIHETVDKEDADKRYEWGTLACLLLGLALGALITWIDMQGKVYRAQRSAVDAQQTTQSCLNSMSKWDDIATKWKENSEGWQRLFFKVYKQEQYK